MKKIRSEQDSLGNVDVPTDALYGAQTQRAVNNFNISGIALPATFIRSLALVKASAAEANAQLGQISSDVSAAIVDAAMQIADGHHADQFPVDVFQTGSGTSTNMNANEVIATMASRALSEAVHPNDQVNCSQSSNDVIPTTIHVSAELALASSLMPALDVLVDSLAAREVELSGVVKTGRTHLMDAMPVTFSQELSGWRAQLLNARQGIDNTRELLRQLAQGGTAVGTGVNAPEEFSKIFCQCLSKKTGTTFTTAPNKFAAIASQDTAVALSGQLRTLAVALTKVSNDLRWMNSGPLTGLAEIQLKALQPGSSIMPGKVNPVIPEAVAMAMVQVMGNDSAIAIAGQSGNFQLNVMLPLIAHNLLQNIELLSNSCRALAEFCIDDFVVKYDNLAANLARNPILVTALNSEVGYARASEIAKAAYAQQRDIFEVALEMTDIDAETLRRLLDPAKLV